jgi:molecular chaperone HtpG
VAVRFVSNGGERYQLNEAPVRPIGTRIKLQLKQECAELADTENVRAELLRYCVLLDLPVYLNGCEQLTNQLEPPWRNPDLKL